MIVFSTKYLTIKASVKECRNNKKRTQNAFTGNEKYYFSSVYLL